MLITLQVFKAEILIVIAPIVIMHYFCVRGQKRQNMIIPNALHVFVLMGSIVSNRFIPIEPEAGPLRIDHNHNFIPIYNRPGDQKQAQVLLELKKNLCLSSL